MTGEKISATLHFFDKGIYIECKELDMGEFINKWDGNAFMKVLNDIEELSNSHYVITEKGEELLKSLKNQINGEEDNMAL